LDCAVFYVPTNTV